MYSVEAWGSHPDEDNDDCWYGSDHESLREAMDAYLATPELGVVFVVLSLNGVMLLERELGATIERGINWTWANFTSGDCDVDSFLAWLEEHGYEHRGCYWDLGLPCVRFR